MSKIITINRQFGSGGRELGKRLAEKLGVAYYDNEIISKIAEKSGLAVEYVNNIVEHKPITYYPITIGRTFMAHVPQPVDFNARIYKEQHDIIVDLASKSDCVIIGRCADCILKEQKPLRIFVFADKESRIARCRMKADESEKMTDKQLSKYIDEIDHGRSEYYRNFTGQKWEDMQNYDLCINTSNVSVKSVAEGLAELMKHQ